MNLDTEVTIAVSAQKTAYAGVLGGFGVSWITMDVLFAIIGTLIAFAGTVVSAYCQLDARRRRKAQALVDEARAQELHAARMQLSAARLDFMRHPRELTPAEERGAHALGLDTGMGVSTEVGDGYID